VPHKSPEKRKEYLAKRYREKREEFKKLASERYHGNRELIRKRRLELAHKHRAKNNEREKIRYAKLRLEIVSEYGGRCACCGESEVLFLELDHVRNDGVNHRKQIGRGSNPFYKWIKKNGFPKGSFQLLCANCNQGKNRNGGMCPHKLKNGLFSFRRQ